MTQALALFDFDGTLRAGDSIISYARFAVKQRRMGCGALALSGAHALGYLMGLENETQSKNHALRFRRPLTEAERDAMDQAFADVIVRQLYPAARDCIREHQRAGRLLLLVTASPACYMDRVGALLGFDATLATPMADGVFVRDNCKGEEKCRRIREWLAIAGIEADFSASFAYGDTKSDLPMLRLCGHPIQVNPCRALRKAAPDMPHLQWTNK